MRNITDIGDLAMFVGDAYRRKKIFRPRMPILWHTGNFDWTSRILLDELDTGIVDIPYRYGDEAYLTRSNVGAVLQVCIHKRPGIIYVPLNLAAPISMREFNIVDNYLCKNRV